MSLERFEAHLRDPAPGFRCYASGDRSQTPGLLARVTNVVGKPGSSKAVDAAARACGEASPALRRFVELHDGVLLYRDGHSNAAGVFFFQAKEWPARTREMRESLEGMGFEGDEMPEWALRGVAFGEIPHSGNVFVIQAEGDLAGRVFYCDHDDFRAEAIANSFEEFLGRIVDDPPGFLYGCGCYARYSDGRTDAQWIPKEYVADSRGA